MNRDAMRDATGSPPRAVVGASSVHCVDVSLRLISRDAPAADALHLSVRVCPSASQLEASTRPLVTVVLPIFNAAAPSTDGAGDDCSVGGAYENGHDCAPPHTASASLANAGLIELSAFDDGSTDETWARLTKHWAPYLRACGWRVVLGRGARPPGGCGFAKNRAVRQSSGVWLLFQDVDDVSLPERLDRQLEAAARQPEALIGTRVRREPDGSTARYVSWANEMQSEQLVLHRFRECTLLMPTWFVSRAAFDETGGFAEVKCEDLLFLHAHVRRGAPLYRVDGPPLVVYRYHAAAATHAIPRQTILGHRVAAFERDQLGAQHGAWSRFTIWGAGRDGRDFFKRLSSEARSRVLAFCDVDAKKVGTTYQYYEHFVPVVHYTQAQPPFVLCVCLDRTNGAFEANLASLGLREGADYLHVG